MKYIIDAPSNLYKIDGTLRVPVKVGEGDLCWYNTYLKAESYTESDRKAIEDEVWKFVREFSCLGNLALKEIYGNDLITDPWVYIEQYSYQEAKAKYEAWMKQKDEIHVGDEIVGIYSDGEKTPPLVVLKVEGNYYYGIYSKTGEYVQGGLNYEKTGRHFDEVVQLLKKIRGEEE